MRHKKAIVKKTGFYIYAFFILAALLDKTTDK
jgi:hypothetical protein